MEITAVIMAGGKGERFWPKSRTNLPKQFLNISGSSKSMIQQCVERLEKLIPIAQIFIVTNELYAELIKIQIPHLPTDNIIIEPIGRNTAPCVGLASIIIEEKFPESTMVVIPSDHIIKNEDELLGILKTATLLSERNCAITLGVAPGYAETGYGYIEISDESSVLNGLPIHKVEKFVEKPDFETAKKYLESGNYYWNSGIFVWKVRVIRNYIKLYMPEMHELLEIMRAEMLTGVRDDVVQKYFHEMPEQSIDYGIMEKLSDIFMIPCEFGWDDVGSWTALERINESDEDGNIVRGNILSIDTKRCIIESNGRLIATLGIEDLIVVETDDVTLICQKDRAQEIKNVIKELKNQKKDQYL